MLQNPILRSFDGVGSSFQTVPEFLAPVPLLDSLGRCAGPETFWLLS